MTSGRSQGNLSTASASTSTIERVGRKLATAKAMDVENPSVGIGSDFLGYRIEELIGRGGMGVVYRAYDLRLKRPVAVKLIAPSLALDERFRDRFERETELVMSLEHPNVVPIYDAGEVDGRVYLAMRLVDGSDLGSLLRTEGPLQPGRAITICTQIASALDAAHARGLVHRDVKPSNVLLDGSEHVYLADFGLSRRVRDQVGERGQDRSIGTPSYIAPEQLEGLAIDGRADVYSLGCLLYECLTGERVFPRDSRLAEAWAHLEEEPPRPSRKRRELPDTVDKVISRALAKKPEERYPTCGALVAAAESALGLRRPPRFGTRATVAIAAVVVALATSLAITLVVLNARGPAASPLTHANTLVRIDPRTNARDLVIDVGSDPAAVATWGKRLWVYSNGANLVTEVDARTNRVLHKTPVSVTPPNLGQTGEGPVFAADQYGAWLVGIDPRAWGLTRVLPSGAQHSYPLPGRPEAVATGLQAVWVIDRGARDDRLLRLNPATGTITRQVPLPASWQVDSLTVGYGYVWLVSTSTARLYRIDPRSAGIDPRSAASRPVQLACGDAPAQLHCIESSTGRPSAMFGYVWVEQSANDDYFVAIDPRTLVTANGSNIASVNGVSVEAFDSVWTYDQADGEVLRFHPPELTFGPADPAAVISVTKQPYLVGGSCLTSIATAGGAIWVTLAPAWVNGEQTPYGRYHCIL
jgi:Protein kinase domain